MDFDSFERGLVSVFFDFLAWLLWIFLDRTEVESLDDWLDWEVLSHFVLKFDAVDVFEDFGEGVFFVWLDESVGSFRTHEKEEFAKLSGLSRLLDYLTGLSETLRDS